MTHELKIQKEYFEAVASGNKTFEVRVNDRDFKVGDFLKLNEVDSDGVETGRSMLVRVTYILDNTAYCKDNMVIMAIEKETIQQYEEIIAFHPGFHVAEIINDMNITQEQFAKRVGCAPKHIRNIISGKSNITPEFAEKLSFMLGTSATMWMNFQRDYDEKVQEIDRPNR